MSKSIVSLLSRFTRFTLQPRSVVYQRLLVLCMSIRNGLHAAYRVVRPKHWVTSTDLAIFASNSCLDAANLVTTIYIILSSYSCITFFFVSSSFVDSSSHSCSRFFTVDSSSAIRTTGNLDREEVFRIEGTDQLNCILQFRDPSTNSERQLLIAIHVLENVEHCGGEPEQADTGILCH